MVMVVEARAGAAMVVAMAAEVKAAAEMGVGVTA